MACILSARNTESYLVSTVMDDITVLSIRKVNTEVSVLKITNGNEANITTAKANGVAVVLIVDNLSASSSIGELGIHKNNKHSKMITSVPHLDSISNGEPPMLTRPSITAVVAITSLQHVAVVNLSSKFSTPYIFEF